MEQVVNELRTEITLEAPAERIWELLADCSLYQHWNPLFSQAKGGLSVGGRLELVVTLPRIAPFRVEPKVLTVEPQKRFSWQHTLLWTGVMTWKYRNELEVIDTQRVRFIQLSEFGGMLGPLFRLGLGESLGAGMEKLNEALRRWGENGNAQCLRC